MTETKKYDIEETLNELGLEGESLEETVQIIIEMREELSESCTKCEEKNLPRSLAIASNSQVIRMIDIITDDIIEKQNILAQAKSGKDIHDLLAVIKAKIETLVVEEKIQPETVNAITKRLRKVNKEDIAKYKNL